MANRTPHSALRTPRLIVPKLLAWFAANARDLPWRRSRDPYAIWVSEIMLQQTQVKTVIPYWERWMRELPTIQSLAKAKPGKIHKLWEGLGYYARVRNMQKAAQQICAEHDSKFPAQFDDILALPGIGRYTAGAIASIAFNQPTPILDGNVIRVLARLHGIGEDPHEKQTNARLWQLAEELVLHASRMNPESFRGTQHASPCSHLNQSLMELGALICTPRSPNCPACPVAKHCIALRENRVEELPRPKQRATVTTRRFIAFIIERDGRFLVQQRAAGVVNAHLWEFPNFEVGARLSPAAALSANRVTTKSHAALANEALRLGQPRSGQNATATSLVVSAEPFCVVKHSITRYRMTVEAHRASFGGRTGTSYTSPKPAGVWRTLAQLYKLPFTSAHRQIATKLGPP